MQRISTLWRRAVCVLLVLLTAAWPFAAFAEYDADHPEQLDEGDLVAESVILIEQESGDVIFDMNPDARMYPASTTKIMTVLLGILYGNLSDTVTVSYGGSQTYVKTVLDPESSLLGLDEGEQIVLEDLLYGCIMRSGNDAALAIAEHISGSEGAFVDLMNRMAQEMGMTGTHYMNAHGLHNENHYTTARDLATLARYAMQNETFAEIVGTVSYEMPATNLSRKTTITTGHRIMLKMYHSEANSYYYEYANGIKSGTTDAAGSCYVGSALKDGVQLISVVLKSDYYNVWRDTKRLLEYGFSQYTRVSFAELYMENPLMVYTIGYDASDKGLGELELSCTPVDPTKTAHITGTHDEIEQLSENLRDVVLVQYTRELKAPITAGEIIGKMTYMTDSGEAVEYNLLATRSIPARKNAPLTFEQILAMTEADENFFPPISVELVLFLLSPVLVLMLIILVIRLFVRRIKKHYAHVPKNKNRYIK